MQVIVTNKNKMSKKKMFANCQTRDHNRNVWNYPAMKECQKKFQINLFFEKEGKNTTISHWKQKPASKSA